MCLMLAAAICHSGKAATVPNILAWTFPRQSSKRIGSFGLADSHIVDDDSYVRILHNLCKYSTEWILIHTWSRNPWTLRTVMRWAFWRIRDHEIPNVFLCLSDSDGKYQKYRRFASFLPIFGEASFELVGQQAKSVGGMYAFKKSAR